MERNETAIIYVGFVAAHPWSAPCGRAAHDPIRSRRIGRDAQSDLRL